MISYSQNREDVLLERVLTDCPHRFYVDVGASHPRIHSVTCHFYNQGWRGVNVEPRPDAFLVLRHNRPEDVNLCVGVSDAAGSMDLEIITALNVQQVALSEGLSTFDRTVGQRHGSEGRVIRTVPTEIVTLASIFEQHVPAEVSFLKIDVEGFEEKVVRGMDWRRWRPRVLVLEAIDAVTQLPNHQSWEPTLLEAGYVFAAFDGVNRYYARGEDRQSIERLACPLDSYVLYDAWRDEKRHEQSKKDLEALGQEIECLWAIRDNLRQQQIDRRRAEERKPKYILRQVRRTLVAKLKLGLQASLNRVLPQTRKPAERDMARLAPGRIETQRSVRLLLEMTATHCYGGNTGIQRVVRSLSRHIDHEATAFNIPCLSVIIHGDRLSSLSRNDQAPRDSTKGRSNTVRRVYQRGADRLCRSVPIPGLRRQLLPPPGRKGIFKGPYMVGRALIAGRRRIRAWINQMDVTPGDVLLMPDSTWDVPTVWRAVERAKKHGAVVGIMVHDIIPFTHPDLCVERHVEGFKTWLDQAVRHADFFVTNSQYVADTLAAHVAKHYPDRSFQGLIEPFLLGASLELPPSSSEDEVRDEVKEALATSGPASTYLSVGSIEPKKNHAYLLDAFERIWQRTPMTRLCIVGREGWGYEETVQKIRANPRFGKQLFAFHDLSDTELDYCYRHTRALVFPSIIEGFGLPLVEALQHGIHVMASDIPIHREVCGDFGLYFDLDDPESLADLLTRFDLDDESVATISPSSFRPISWHDSTRQFLDATLRCLKTLAKRSPDQVAVPVDSAETSPSPSDQPNDRAA